LQIIILFIWKALGYEPEDTIAIEEKNS